jgi:hypothetical protein
VFFRDGSEVLATRESAKRLNAKSGPCEYIDGAMKPELPVYEIDELRCTPGGSILGLLTERMDILGLTFGYWPKGVTEKGPPLNGEAFTLEIMAAMQDERSDEPQLIPLYNALMPETLVAARRRQPPPPLLIQVARNDLIEHRLGRDQAERFLSVPTLIFAGAGVTGGWLVRTLDVVPDGTRWLEQLLVNPDAAPWPAELQKSTLKVASRYATLK